MKFRKERVISFIYQRKNEVSELYGRKINADINGSVVEVEKLKTLTIEKKTRGPQRGIMYKLLRSILKIGIM